MNITVMTRSDCCEKVIAECSPLEWLILNSALKRYKNNNEVHPDDRRIARSLFEIKPVFKEIEQDNN